MKQTCVAEWTCKGDQTVINGDDFKVFETDTIDLLDPSGQKVATATVDDQEKVITVTYTDYPERMANVTGNASLCV